MNKSIKAMVLAIIASFPAISALAADAEEKIPVIIVFQKETPFHQLTSYAATADARAKQHPEGWSYLDKGVLGAVKRLEGVHHFSSTHVFSHAVKGFAVSLTQAQITALKSEPTIASIEVDAPIKVNAQELPWGISKVGADKSSTQAGNGSGAITNVNAYVIDTGIAREADLNVVKFVNFIDSNNTDCNGHGTHVAGTIGAIDNGIEVVGVAPGIKLTAVKVLDCNGSGTTSSVIKGIDWVTANAVRPAVANMSLGGGASSALDNAVLQSANSNIFYALAAGNSGADACNSSPARIGFNQNGVANGIIATAAIGSDSTETSWSNYGKCVDVWAPGLYIDSTNYKGGTPVTMSGTSMASPHTAGAAALYLSRHSTATASQVEQAILTYSVNAGTRSKDGNAVKLLQVNSF